MAHDVWTESPLTREILSAALDGSPADVDVEEIAAVVGFSDRLGVTPIVARHWEAAGLSWPDKARHLQHRAALRLIDEVALRTVECLHDAGIESLFLKGVPLSSRLFESPHMRTTTDVDLLVDPEHVSEAIAAMEEAGLVVVGDFKPWFYNQILLVDPTYHVHVELHWALAFPVLPTPVLSELRPLFSPVRAYDYARTLGPSGTLLSLLYHFQQHQGALKTVIDLAAWFERCAEEVSVEAVMALLWRYDLVGILDWALGAIARLVPADVWQECPGFVSFLDGRKRRADWSAKIWSRVTERCLRGCLLRESPWAQLVLYSDAEIDHAKTTAVQCAALLPTSRGLRRPVRALRPLVFGPHRVGRLVFRAARSSGFYTPERSHLWPV